MEKGKNTAIVAVRRMTSYHCLVYKSTIARVHTYFNVYNHYQYGTLDKKKTITKRKKLSFLKILKTYKKKKKELLNKTKQQQSLKLIVLQAQTLSSQYI